MSSLFRTHRLSKEDRELIKGVSALAGKMLASPYIDERERKHQRMVGMALIGHMVFRMRFRKFEEGRYA